MWQEKFEQYRERGFTVVGVALDVEGIEPAKKYYDEFGVTFPSLVDPNYATRFGVVPLTFFVNEHGIVQTLDDWESKLRDESELEQVTSADRAMFSPPGRRQDATELAALASRVRSQPQNLEAAVDLASRYLEPGLKPEAAAVLRRAVEHRDPLTIARADDSHAQRLLANAYLQLSRASETRDDQVRYATLSYFLNPTVGFAKQIARIIAPEKFDGRPDGSFDNEFRESTRRQLEAERREWLTSGSENR